MNAAVLAPARIVREAHAVLHEATALPWPKDDAGLVEVALAFIALGEALDTYRELDSGALHWEPVFPHLSGEADPDTEALRKQASEVEAAAGDLLKVMAKHGITVADEIAEAAR